MLKTMPRGGFVAMFCAWCALLPVNGMACIWDRDTLAMEGKGLPDTVNVLIGRFERQPPAYYEMRLARVAALIRAGKGQLADYDDAGAAADRLKRGDEAIEWMREKKKRLDSLGAGDPAHKEHLYRYHANLGTFHAHRWLGPGASRERLDDLKAAREHIARAIAINPDAHFGRERYQLMAIDWLLAPPAVEGHPSQWTIISRPGEMPRGRNFLEKAGFGDAVKGLSGLVVLGAAWESLDIFAALAYALDDQGHSGLGYLAQLRMRELVGQGRKSLHPAIDGEKLTNLVTYFGDLHQRRDQSRRYFEPARQAAEAWHAHRTAFMTARLNQGRHPDTDPGFWQGYEELPGIDLPDKTLWEKLLDWLQQNFFVLFLLMVFGFPAWKFVSWIWRRRKP